MNFNITIHKNLRNGICSKSRIHGLTCIFGVSLLLPVADSLYAMNPNNSTSNINVVPNSVNVIDQNRTNIHNNYSQDKRNAQTNDTQIDIYSALNTIETLYATYLLKETNNSTEDLHTRLYQLLSKIKRNSTQSNDQLNNLLNRVNQKTLAFICMLIHKQNPTHADNQQLNDIQQTTTRAIIAKLNNQHIPYNLTDFNLYNYASCFQHIKSLDDLSVFSILTQYSDSLFSTIEQALLHGCTDYIRLYTQIMHQILGMTIDTNDLTENQLKSSLESMLTKCDVLLQLIQILVDDHKIDIPTTLNKETNSTQDESQLHRYYNLLNGKNLPTIKYIIDLVLQEANRFTSSPNELFSDLIKILKPYSQTFEKPDLINMIYNTIKNLHFHGTNPQILAQVIYALLTSAHQNNILNSVCEKFSTNFLAQCIVTSVHERKHMTGSAYLTDPALAAAAQIVIKNLTQDKIYNHSDFELQYYAYCLSIAKPISEKTKDQYKAVVQNIYKVLNQQYNQPNCTPDRKIYTVIWYLCQALNNDMPFGNITKENYKFYLKYIDQNIDKIGNNEPPSKDTFIKTFNAFTDTKELSANLHNIVSNLQVDANNQLTPSANAFLKVVEQFTQEKINAIAQNTTNNKLSDTDLEELSNLIQILNIAKYPKVDQEHRQLYYQKIYQIFCLSHKCNQFTDLFNQIPVDILAYCVVACNFWLDQKPSNYDKHKDMIQTASQIIIDKLPKNNINNATAFQLQNYAYCLLIAKPISEKTKEQYKAVAQNIYNTLNHKYNQQNYTPDTTIYAVIRHLCKVLNKDMPFSNVTKENYKFYLEYLNKNINKIGNNEPPSKDTFINIFNEFKDYKELSANLHNIVQNLPVDTNNQLIPSANAFLKAVEQFTQEKIDKIDTKTPKQPLNNQDLEELNDTDLKELSNLIQILNIAKYTKVDQEHTQLYYQKIYKIFCLAHERKQLTDLCNLIQIDILAYCVTACDCWLDKKQHNYDKHDYMKQIAAKTVIKQLQDENINNATAFQLQNYAYCLSIAKPIPETKTETYKTIAQNIYNTLNQKYNQPNCTPNTIIYAAICHLCHALNNNMPFSKVTKENYKFYLKYIDQNIDKIGNNQQPSQEKFIKIFNKFTDYKELSSIIFDIASTTTNNKQLPNAFLDAVEQFTQEKINEIDKNTTDKQLFVQDLNELSNLIQILSIAKYTNVDQEHRRQYCQKIYTIFCLAHKCHKLTDLCNRIPIYTLASCVSLFNGWLNKTQRNDKKYNEMIQMAAETVIKKLTGENINNATVFQLQHYAYCLLQLKDTNKFQNNYQNQIQLIYNQLQTQPTSDDIHLKYCCKSLCEALGVNVQTIPNPNEEKIKVSDYLELLKDALEANNILQDQE